MGGRHPSHLFLRRPLGNHPHHIPRPIQGTQLDSTRLWSESRRTALGPNMVGNVQHRLLPAMGGKSDIRCPRVEMRLALARCA